MSILLRLPTDLVCAVLSQWLKLKDVSLLDRAFCKKQERENLLKVFNSPCCTVSHISYVGKEKVLMNWLTSRKLRVGELFVTRATVNACLVYVEMFGKSIRCIQIHEIDLASAAGKYLSAAICTHCTGLVSFLCFGCKVCETLLDILYNCSNLEDYMLVKCAEEFTCSFVALDHVASVATKVSNVALDVSLSQTAHRAIQHYIAPSQLQRLYVGYFDNQVPEILQVLKQSGQSLCCLGFTNAPCVPDNLLTGAIIGCPYIFHLDMSFCTELTDASLEIVARHLTQLQTIIVTAYNLTDAGIGALAQYRADTLQALFVCSSLALNGVGYNTVLEHCHQLHTLGIDLASPLTEALDKRLLGNIRTLQTDWLRGNKTNLMLSHFTCLENLYIGGYDTDSWQFPFLLPADSAPALRNVILDSTSSYRHGCIYSSIQNSSRIFNAGSPPQEVAIAALLAQRPHLHVRFDAGGDWPSNIMQLPI